MPVIMNSIVCIILNIIIPPGRKDNDILTLRIIYPAVLFYYYF